MDPPDELWKTLGLDEELAKESTRVRIRTEARRYGKRVTVLEGFDAAVDLEGLARELKRAIGVGGTARPGRVELQGDQRRAARAALEGRGFLVE